MRSYILLCSAMLAIGCGANETELRYTSSLQSPTVGLVLSESGLDGFAGMIGSTCTIDTRWGCPTEDENLPTDDERVVDHYQGQTLAMSSQGVHVLTDARWDQSMDISRAQIKKAKMSAFGPLMLTSTDAGCELQDAIGGLGVQAPQGACTEGASLDIDRANAELYVATNQGISRVSAQGSDDISTGDLVSYDSIRKQVYVATKGESLLRALTRDGEQVWDTNVDGAIMDLKARGERGDLLVLVDRDDRGYIQRRAGDNGQLLSENPIPESDGQLVVSENGVTIAVVKPDAVHFYEMDVAGEEKPVDQTPADCMTLDTVQRD